MSDAVLEITPVSKSKSEANLNVGTSIVQPSRKNHVLIAYAQMQGYFDEVQRTIETQGAINSIQHSQLRDLGSQDREAASFGYWYSFGDSMHWGEFARDSKGTAYSVQEIQRLIETGEVPTDLKLFYPKSAVSAAMSIRGTIDRVIHPRIQKSKRNIGKGIFIPREIGEGASLLIAAASLQFMSNHDASTYLAQRAAASNKSEKQECLKKLLPSITSSPLYVFKDIWRLPVPLNGRTRISLIASLVSGAVIDAPENAYIIAYTYENSALYKLARTKQSTKSMPAVDMEVLHTYQGADERNYAVLGLYRTELLNRVGDFALNNSESSASCNT